MNVDTLLTNTLSLVTCYLSLVTPNMHKIRRAVLSACVHSLLTGNAASVTSMGRGITSSTHEKHNIKRADRLCSNSHLLLESDHIYTAMCYLFGRKVPSVDTGKAIMKGIEGAATGVAASVPAIAIGPSIATDVAGATIAVSMEEMKKQ